MTHDADAFGLDVDPLLRRFLEEEALPGTGIDSGAFWAGFEALLGELTPENERLIARREELQALIGARDASLEGRLPSPEEEERFLRDIGYLVDPPAPFIIGTSGIDDGVARVAGPQLVVPVDNARYAINAANARWGSLYDALYGTDALGEPPPPGDYDPERGKRVIAWGWRFLDDTIPLESGSWADMLSVWVAPDGRIFADCADRDRFLAKPEQFVGGDGGGPGKKRLLFRNNGLHIELVIDHEHPIGRTNAGALADIVLESAITAIMDFEDSVAAVDAEEKVGAYRNWLGLMKGDITARFARGGRTVERRLAADRTYLTPDRQDTLTLSGRALLLVRNVGHLMTNPMMRLDGAEVREGLADAVVTSLCALHTGRGRPIYIVKPKMHGPEEAAFANRLFDRTEDLLGLPRHTIKIGVMDEERRTSLNLAATIHAVKDRVAFINTGFLDRTGDEIHTAMRLGPAIRKAEMKAAPWFAAYESNNVDVGLACGFAGRAQIGKGMWAMPDRMADMLAQKQAHPEAGATTAWVPSPTAATLHAIHYHRVDVAARQRALAARAPVRVTEMLAIPVEPEASWSAEEIGEELDNNVQGILGYVVRWIEQGVGCSKVPDVHDVGLMEDRATCRISSQHIANWLLHEVVTEAQVRAALLRMAAVVDGQNEGDPFYRPMLPDTAKSLAFAAASALVFEGAAQPSGYTEPLLHAFRLKLKAALSG